MAATTYTLTGPSLGVINTASSAFTVTPDAAYTGTITITPTGGVSGVSAVTKTFSSSATPQTFVITPTATGTVTLSGTNSGSLANPAALHYVVYSDVYSTPTFITAETAKIKSLTGSRLIRKGIDIV